MNDIRFETERLRLRSWRRTDIEPFGRVCNTPAVMHWLGGVQTRRELTTDVKYFIKTEKAEGHTFWVVERKFDNLFFGFCGVIRILDRDCPAAGKLEIGWRIREDQWRNGYAFEAAAVTLADPINRHGGDEIVSRTAAGNVASQGLMLKLGMLREQSLTYIPNGEDEALVIYVLPYA